MKLLWVITLIPCLYLGKHSNALLIESLIESLKSLFPLATALKPLSERVTEAIDDTELSIFRSKRAFKGADKYLKELFSGRPSSEEYLGNLISNVKKSTHPDEIESSLDELKMRTFNFKMELNLIDFLFADQVKDDWRAYRSKIIVNSEEIVADAKTKDMLPILGPTGAGAFNGNILGLEAYILRLKANEEWQSDNLREAFEFIKSINSFTHFFPYPKKVCFDQ